MHTTWCLYQQNNLDQSSKSPKQGKHSHTPLPEQRVQNRRRSVSVAACPALSLHSLKSIHSERTISDSQTADPSTRTITVHKKTKKSTKKKQKPQQRMKCCLCPLVLFGCHLKSLNTRAHTHTHTHTGKGTASQSTNTHESEAQKLSRFCGLQRHWSTHCCFNHRRKLLPLPPPLLSLSLSLSLSLCISLSHSVSLSVTVLSLAVCLSLWRYGAPAQRQGVNFPILVLLFSSSFVFCSPSPGCARVPWKAGS